MPHLGLPGTRRVYRLPGLGRRTPRRGPVLDRFRGAGGILGPDEKRPDDPPADLLVGRSFSHPALRDRKVVRLVAGPLAAAVELEMKVLGFDDPRDLGRVGLRQRQALGFPE